MSSIFKKLAKWLVQHGLDELEKEGERNVASRMQAKVDGPTVERDRRRPPGVTYEGLEHTRSYPIDSRPSDEPPPGG